MISILDETTDPDAEYELVAQDEIPDILDGLAARQSASFATRCPFLYYEFEGMVEQWFDEQAAALRAELERKRVAHVAPQIQPYLGCIPIDVWDR